MSEQVRIVCRFLTGQDRAGEIWRQPDLLNTLQKLVDA